MYTRVLYHYGDIVKLRYNACRIYENNNNNHNKSSNSNNNNSNSKNCVCVWNRRTEQRVLWSYDFHTTLWDLKYVVWRGARGRVRFRAVIIINDVLRMLRRYEWNISVIRRFYNYYFFKDNISSQRSLLWWRPLSMTFRTKNIVLSFVVHYVGIVLQCVQPILRALKSTPQLVIYSYTYWVSENKIRRAKNKTKQIFTVLVRVVMSREWWQYENSDRTLC